MSIIIPIRSGQGTGITPGTAYWNAHFEAGTGELTYIKTNALLPGNQTIHFERTSEPLGNFGDIAYCFMAKIVGNKQGEYHAGIAYLENKDDGRGVLLKGTARTSVNLNDQFAKEYDYMERKLGHGWGIQTFTAAAESDGKTYASALVIAVLGIVPAQEWYEQHGVREH